MATMKKYFSGRSLEQAVMAAASELDIPREELRYEEVDKRHGFVRTRRKVVISVDPDNPRLGGEEPQAAKPETTPEDGPRRRRRRRRGEEERPRRARAERPAPEPEPEVAAYEEPEEEDEEDDDEPAPRPTGARHRTPGWWHARPVRDEEDEEGEDEDHGDLDDEDDDEDDLEDAEVQDDDEDDDEREVAAELPRRRRRWRGGRRGGPEKEREEVTAARREPPRPKPERAPSRGRETAESGRGRRGGGGREERGPRSPQPAPENRREERAERGGGGRRRRRGGASVPAGDGRRGRSAEGRQGRGGGRRPEQRSLGARQEAVGRPQGGGDRSSLIPDRSRRLERAEGEPAEATLDALELLLEFCGIEAQAEIYQGEGDRLEVELWGPDDRVLLADDGKVLLAMEHIIPRMIRTTLGEALPVRVDCDNFHMIREERLRDLAQRVAGEVARSGNPRTLDEMDPAERRIIHITLESDASVETESVGRGYYKRVRVRPQ